MRLLSSLLAASIALAPGIAGHEPQAGSANYRELVSTYRRADRQAIERVLAIPTSEIQSLVDRAVSDSRDQSMTWQELRAAAILHTEAWHQQAVTAGGKGAGPHLDAALRLLDAVHRADSEQWTYIQRWRAVVAGVLLRVGDKLGHDDFRKRMRTAFPLTKWQIAAMAAVGDGVDAETLANDAGRPLPSRTVSAQTVEDQRTRGWSEAATAYEEALRQEPGYRLASMRLGRVRVLQGRFDDAIAPLQAARNDSDPRVAYLALLYLGSLWERNHRFDEAERAYTEAVRRYPRGQSAPLALAHLLTRTGRDSETLALVTAMLGIEWRVEPLWTLWARPNQDLRDYAHAFAELVAEVEEPLK